jgi:acetolactate synthase-1/3 small subunit
MTIVARGDERILEQIIKQLEKLIDVIMVVDISDADIIERELVMIKVRTKNESRTDVTQIVNTFRAKILDVKSESMTVEVTGNESKIDAVVELLKPYGILETVRTGTIALSRTIELRAPSLACCSQKAATVRRRSCGKTKISKNK